MRQNSAIIPANQERNFIQIIGLGTSIATHVVNYLARYTAELVIAGVTGVIIEIERSRITIRYTKRQLQAQYAIGIRTDLALRFSQAIDYIENHPNIRPSIKTKVIAELEQILDLIFEQLREELARDS